MNFQKVNQKKPNFVVKPLVFELLFEITKEEKCVPKLEDIFPIQLNQNLKTKKLKASLTTLQVGVSREPS